MNIFDIFRSLQIAIALAGVVIVYYAYKGHRRTKSRSLLFLAVGFVFITIGTVVDGLLFEFLGFDLISGEIVEACSQLSGFLLIIYSIVGPGD